MDDGSYQETLVKSYEKFESLCIRCGACCGAKDDPCINLKKDETGYYCSNYEKRLGPQVTVSGMVFNCVSIREHIRNGTLVKGCGYKIITFHD